MIEHPTKQQKQSDTQESPITIVKETETVHKNEETMKIQESGPHKQSENIALKQDLSEQIRIEKRTKNVNLPKKFKGIILQKVLENYCQAIKAQFVFTSFQTLKIYQQS